jgi:hypothetical protein
VDLTSALPIIIASPFVDAVADRGMGWMTPPVAPPLIGIQPRAASRKVFDDEPMTSPPVRVVAHPKTLLARLTRDDTDDRGPIVGIGAVALALIGTSTWGGTGIAMGRAFVPPRSGSVRRPQTPCRSSPRLVRCRSGAAARAGVTCATACVTCPIRGLSARWVRLWPCRAAGGPAWRGGGGSWQRRCSSGVSRSHHTRGNGRPESRPAAEKVGARDDDREAMPSPPDAGDAPTREDSYYHPTGRQAGNQSYRHDITPSTLVTHELNQYC